MEQETQFIESLYNVLEGIPPDSESFQITQELIHQLQSFFHIMRESDPQNIGMIFDSFNTTEPLFQELGKLLREFHEQWKTIDKDLPKRIGELANHDMEDATSRLLHIVSMTENAANKTMDLSEEVMNKLADRSSQYQAAQEHLDALISQNADSGHLQFFQNMLRQFQEEDDTMQQQLTDILVAQDYQDLTGQVINKIVKLLNSLENEMVELVKTFGQIYSNRQNSQEELQGPLQEDSVNRQSQDNVDDLLASLGF
ncbi:MAG: protein phosphatase CheZ [SAR324 cluster bacterium]|nr:protein phosphatase CheZ [SAR324 cluster bacterium]